MKNIEDLKNDLQIFTPQIVDNHIEIIFPIILDIKNNCFVLVLQPNQDGFLISDDGYTFERLNKETKHYFSLFASKFPTICNGYKVDGEKIYKKYQTNQSVTHAINQFLRFFIEIDNFISKNHLE